MCGKKLVFDMLSVECYWNQWIFHKTVTHSISKYSRKKFDSIWFGFYEESKTISKNFSHSKYLTSSKYCPISLILKSQFVAIWNKFSLSKLYAIQRHLSRFLFHLMKWFATTMFENEITKYFFVAETEKTQKY